MVGFWIPTVSLFCSPGSGGGGPLQPSDPQVQGDSHDPGGPYAAVPDQSHGRVCHPRGTNVRSHDHEQRNEQPHLPFPV